MSLTRTRLRVAVRVMGYYNSVPLYRGHYRHSPCKGAGQTTSLLVVMIFLFSDITSARLRAP